MSSYLSYKPFLVEEAVVADIANGEVLVATSDNQKALVLNDTGAIVLSLCTGEYSIGQIATLLSETQGAAPEQAQADLLALVQRLDQEGLLRKPAPVSI